MATVIARIVLSVWWVSVQELICSTEVQKFCYSLLLRRKKTEDPFTRLLGHSLFLSLQVDQLVVSCSVSEAIAWNKLWKCFCFIKRQSSLNGSCTTQLKAFPLFTFFSAVRGRSTGCIHVANVFFWKKHIRSIKKRVGIEKKLVTVSQIFFWKKQVPLAKEAEKKQDVMWEFVFFIKKQVISEKKHEPFSKEAGKSVNFPASFLLH